MSTHLLNVADVRLRSRVNGPGLRSVVWVQGCTIGCPGCFNPHTHPHQARRLVNPARLARTLVAVPETDGITISGGEPFEQAEACAVLAEAARVAGRSVMVFSGYPFGHLTGSRLPAVRRFLAAIDLLIAGPYVKKAGSANLLWRSSSNQTVHFLTNRLTEAAKSTPQDAPVVEIGMDGTRWSSSGFPGQEDLAWFDRITTGRVDPGGISNLKEETDGLPTASKSL